MTEPVVKPIHAREGDQIDVYWHCNEGIFVQRVTCPPKTTREVRKSVANEHVPKPVIDLPLNPMICQCGHWKVAHFESGTGHCAASNCHCSCYVPAEARDA